MRLSPQLRPLSNQAPPCFWAGVTHIVGLFGPYSRSLLTLTHTQLHRAAAGCQWNREAG